VLQLIWPLCQRFTTLIPGGNVLKLFFIVTNEENK
jgi:hypothetical protein